LREFENIQWEAKKEGKGLWVYSDILEQQQYDDEND